MIFVKHVHSRKAPSWGVHPPFAFEALVLELIPSLALNGKQGIHAWPFSLKRNHIILFS